MAAYDLEEQEQLLALKDWWHKNSNLITWVVVVCALAFAGWTGWNRYQATQAAETGVLYAAIEQADQGKDIAKQRALTDEMLGKYGKSPLAQLSALMMAKSEVAAGDAKAAQTRLQWAIEHGADPLVADLARLRLATQQLDAKDLDGALKTLNVTPDKSMEARFEDLRGDTLFAKGDQKAALEAYQKALTALGENSGQASAAFRTVLQTKLDALGGV